MSVDGDASSDPVEDLPPSCKLVYITLEREGRLTSAKLAEKTRLAPRTVRYAIEKLEANEPISSQVYLADTRETVYEIDDDG